MENTEPGMMIDTTLDNAAWALAKFRLGPDAKLSEVIALAQKIKTEELCSKR